MTPEDRINLVRIYPYYNFNGNDITDYFHEHSEYKKARDIYWYYLNITGISPNSDKIPPVKTEEEYVLWYKFHLLMKRKFYIQMNLEERNKKVRT